MISKWTFLATAVTCIAMMTSDAQVKEANYDESKAGNFPLPNPLKMEDGRAVSSVEMWEKERRPEIFRMFESLMYGKAPVGRPDGLTFEKRNEDKNVLGGRATRREVSIYLNKEKSGPRLDLLMYIPNESKRPAPAFLGLNFEGNHSINADPGITITTNWVPSYSKGSKNNRASEASRGEKSSRWPVEDAISRGYAVCTMYNGDIDPDFHDGFKNGVHGVYSKGARGESDWGTIAAWSWGLSRALDYLETDKDIDAKHVAVLGHSRLGKASLWAGATDPRFAIVISNDSGCGGAALNKRIFGEAIDRINSSFPHWFCGEFKKFNGREEALPFDQHELIALMAPRPVYIASASEDLWADPKGEFLSGVNATPVYKLFGKEGLPVAEMPKADHPVMGTIGYHLRTGKHDITAYDWEQYMNFADKHWGKPK